MSFIGLAQGAVINLFMLLGFVAVFSMTRGWSVAQGRSVPPWVIGGLFGAMAVVAMLVPTATGPGIMFDCRSGVIGAGALLFGPMCALASLPLPCVYRLHVGGLGAVPGLLEIVLPAMLGTLVHIFFRRRHQNLTLRRAVLSSLIVGFAGNVIIASIILMLMPFRELFPAIGSLVIVVLSAPVAMAIFSTLLVLERTHFEAVEVVADGERRMLHSQKMAAVGQVARRVAHDSLNALTGILGSAQLAKDDAGAGPEVRRLMDSIIANVRRMSALAGDVLAFSSLASLRVLRLDLGRCLRGMDRLLANALAPSVEVVIDAPENVCPVDMDPDRIEQAIMHLAINAGEAMSGSGRLTVALTRPRMSTACSRRLQAAVHAGDFHRGDFALVSVTDTGCGMSEEVVSHLFEPFFTTKTKKENAGLGLATVYNIIRGHNGYIEARSQLGRGTTFLIYLPIREEAWRRPA
jgi:signal transduction histidine kinase